MTIQEHVQLLVERYPVLEVNQSQIEETYHLLMETIQSGGTIYMCGNGGSYSDGQHIVGELLKSFDKKRELNSRITEKLVSEYGEEGQYLADNLEAGIDSMVLGSQDAFAYAFSNDVDANLVFAQDLLTRGTEKDTLLCLSSSGNSKNVRYAAMIGKMIGMNVVLLSGQQQGKIAEYTNCNILVPETETYKIQELHLPIYHCLCLAVEDSLF